MNKYFTTIILAAFIMGCSSQQKISDEIRIIRTTPENGTQNLEIEFTKGPEFNHPSFAIWTEDLEGNYIETLYVTQFVGSGKFGHGEIKPGKWSNEPGTARRPASLPYWAHKRNIQAPDGLYIPSPETAVPDAITGATPQGNFRLESASKVKNKKFKLLLEINQPWDSNRFWTNSKFPDDLDYFSSLQPALVYETTIDSESNQAENLMQLIGHAEPSGKNGNLYSDLNTLTTAKEIAQKIVVRLK